MIEGALRTERVFVGDSIMRKIDKTREKMSLFVLPGARIKHEAEKVENILGHEQGKSILIHVGKNNADREGTSRTVQRCRQLVWKHKKTRVYQIILSEILPVMGGRRATTPSSSHICSSRADV